MRLGDPRKLRELRDSALRAVAAALIRQVARASQGERRLDEMHILPIGERPLPSKSVADTIILREGAQLAAGPELPKTHRGRCLRTDLSPLAPLIFR
jgi:hypothetical protein